VGTGGDPTGAGHIETCCSAYRKTPSQEGLPLEHVAGDRCIQEDLLGLTFRISPHAFFQVALCPWWTQHQGGWGQSGLRRQQELVLQRSGETIHVREPQSKI
jgi:hypothetical protein